jgi:hypothetical protein
MPDSTLVHLVSGPSISSRDYSLSRIWAFSLAISYYTNMLLARNIIYNGTRQIGQIRRMVSGTGFAR